MPSALRLGKQPARRDPRTLELARYVDAALPPPPPHVDWTPAVKDWGMLKNDQLSDCVIAMVGHYEQCASASVGREIVPTDAQALAGYEQVGHYDPARMQPDGSNPTDQGCVLLDAMNAWRKAGLFGRLIFAFAAVRPANTTLVQQCVDLYGGLCIGLELPLSAQDQAIWSVPKSGPVGPGAPGSWGGHGVPILGYDPAYFYVLTWGGVKKMSRSFFAHYCDEAYVPFSGDFVSLKTGRSPAGLDVTAMKADLALVAAA